MSEPARVPADEPVHDAVDAVDVVDVVIVTYGRADLVERCLGSLSSPELSDLVRVTVVDNCSPDATPDMIRRAFPHIALIERSDNAGFAVANNVALRSADAPFVLVLNPDTEISRDTLDHLLVRLRAEPDIGVIGCRLVTLDGTFDHASKRFVPTPVEAVTYFAGRLVGRKWGRYVASALGEHDTGDVDAVNGAFMLVRQEALREVGPLDESYWMYGEDLDWCARFREAGWRVVYDGRVTAVHIKGGSSNSRRSVKLNYHFHRSMAIFYRRHLARQSVLPVRLAVQGAIWARFALVQTTNWLHGLRRGRRA